MRLSERLAAYSLDDACLTDLYPLLVLFSEARSILATGELDLGDGKTGTSHREANIPYMDEKMPLKKRECGMQWRRGCVMVQKKCRQAIELIELPLVV